MGRFLAVSVTRRVRVCPARRPDASARIVHVSVPCALQARPTANTRHRSSPGCWREEPDSARRLRCRPRHQGAHPQFGQVPSPDCLRRLQSLSRTRAGSRWLKAARASCRCWKSRSQRRWGRPALPSHECIMSRAGNKPGSPCLKEAMRRNARCARSFLCP